MEARSWAGGSLTMGDRVRPPMLWESAPAKSAYGTVLDQAEVSPDSNPSAKIGTVKRCPWML